MKKRKRRNEILDKVNKKIVCDTCGKTKFAFEGNVWGENGALKGDAYADAIDAGWALSNGYTTHACPKCAGKANKAESKKSSKPNKPEKKSPKGKGKSKKLSVSRDLVKSLNLNGDFPEQN